MKSRVRSAATIAATSAAFSAVLLAGCAATKTKRVSAERFLEKAKIIEQTNSAYWARYIGASATRAYLEYQSVVTLRSRPRAVVFWTPLQGLPGETLQKNARGRSPLESRLSRRKRGE